jgi:hypothetical protein
MSPFIPPVVRVGNSFKQPIARDNTGKTRQGKIRGKMLAMRCACHGNSLQGGNETGKRIAKYEYDCAWPRRMPRAALGRNAE